MDILDIRLTFFSSFDFQTSLLMDAPEMKHSTTSTVWNENPMNPLPPVGTLAPPMTDEPGGIRPKPIRPRLKLNCSILQMFFEWSKNVSTVFSLA